jgi:DNA-binding transcriptional ArsR family regulator
MDREAYVRSHPIRARILVLYEEKPKRSLAPAELTREFRDQFVTPAGVSYHLRVLRGAGLLPKD